MRRKTAKTQGFALLILRFGLAVVAVLAAAAVGPTLAQVRQLGRGGRRVPAVMGGLTAVRAADDLRLGPGAFALDLAARLV